MNHHDGGRLRLEHQDDRRPTTIHSDDITRRDGALCLGRPSLVPLTPWLCRLPKPHLCSSGGSDVDHAIRLPHRDDREQSLTVSETSPLPSSKPSEVPWNTPPTLQLSQHAPSSKPMDDPTKKLTAQPTQVESTKKLTPAPRQTTRTRGPHFPFVQHKGLHGPGHRSHGRTRRVSGPSLPVLGLPGCAHASKAVKSTPNYQRSEVPDQMTLQGFNQFTSYFSLLT